MAGKKYWWIWGGIVWVLLLEIGMLWNKRPELSRISGELAMSADMTCYVVDETEKSPVFYEVNKSGEILRFFRDTSEEGRIFCITWTEEGICYLKQETGNVKQDTYGIYQLEKKFEKVRRIGRLELKAGSRPADMESDGSYMYLAVIEEDNTKLSLYQWKINGKKKVQPKQSQSIEAEKGRYFTDGAYWGERIYGLTDSGTMVSAEKKKNEIKEEAGGITWLTATRAGILFETYPDRNLCVKGSRGRKKYQGLEGAAQADAMSQKAFWTLQKTSRNSTFLNLTQNDKNTKVTELHMEIKDYLSLRKWTILLTAVLGTAVWVILAGAARIFLGKPPLWIKMTTAIFVIQFLAAVMPGREKDTNWEEMALLWGKREIEHMEQDIHTKTQYEENIKISSMVIYAEGRTGYILSAPDKAYGYDLSKLCSKTTLDIITLAQEEGEAKSHMMEKNCKYAEAVFPLGDRITADTFLLVQMEQLPGTETFRQKYSVFFWILADSMLLGVVCFILLHPVKKFAGIVNQIAEGKQEVIPVSRSRELEQAWHSVQVLLFQREREQHEAEQKILSSSRFIPEYFLKLMEKNSMDQVIPGEMKAVEGGLLQISLGNLKDMQEPEHGEERNRLVELLEQEREKKPGVLFWGGNRLGSMRMVYEKIPEAAVQDAIGVWKRINGAPDKIKQINPMFLLHRGTCMCGAAGTGRQVIPFAVSKELERLEQIAEQFQENQVRMAVTEEMRSYLRPKQECRYVGYIVEEERKYRFYEVLDVYQEEEKQRRSKAKEKFEAAIELFYQNDFYLARLGFSEVLKECPKDRMAVWYLFACERMFHGEYEAELRHDLFLNTF